MVGWGLAVFALGLGQGLGWISLEIGHEETRCFR
ncbi:hypothetical protein RS9917_03513 [Synechococcus sp. RS9917]|nr:hypothetical protein RS9917_03513 [Synechococcus sp. RS9917]